MVNCLNLTQRFLEARAAAHGPTVTSPDDEQEKLFINDADPAWLRDYNTILGHLTDIRRDIDRISSKQEQKRQLQFQEALNREIMVMRGELVQKMQQAAHLITHFNKHQRPGDSEQRLFFPFIKKQLSSEMATQTELFRQLQSRFLDTIAKPQRLDIAQMDEQARTYYQQAEQTISADQQEVRQICKDINEIVQMVGQLSAQVYECGTILDRIDANLTQAEVFIQEGNQNLEQARKTQKTVNKLRASTYTLIFVNYVLCVTMIVVKVVSKRQ